ncbi:MAG TPA: alpha/beta fold hydrolase [Pyrinomonadaceae bacterium]|nr:alpha/beta fold hydrolase [Pyrinomonadaceae bacterium]
MRTTLKTTFKSLAICLLAVAFAQAASAQSTQTKNTTTSVAATQNIAGNWHGTISAGRGQYRLVLKVAQSPSGALTAALDSLDQNLADLPLEAVTYADRILRFELPAATPAVFEGALSRDGTEIAGFWQQGGPVPLVFTREQPNATPAPAVAAASTRGRVQLQPCGLPNISKDALCGQYEVFENRDAKTGRKIKLNLMVLPALSDKPAADPIFYLAGGPGAGATYYANASFILPLHRTRDVVLLDQRGTGKSNPLRCDLRGDASDMNGYFSDRLTPEAMRACRTELEKVADLKLYTTTVAMGDLDEVRSALGYDKINVYGGSYGSTAALAYLRFYPQNIRTVTVSSVAPLGLRLPLSFGKGVDHALEQLFADCDADVACHRAFPELRKEFAAVVERLDKGPVTFDTLNPSTGKKQQVTMTRTGFGENVRLMLYHPDVMALMPLLIHQMYQQDYGYFGVVGYQVFHATDSVIARGMQFSVLCAEDIPFLTDADIKQQLTGTFYGDASARLYQKSCAEWPRGEVPAKFAEPIKSDVPVLILSGDIDPVTPPELATPLLRGLPNGRQIILRNATHDTYDCSERLAREFIERGTAQGLDASCADEIKRLPFTTMLPPLPMPK